MTEYGFTQIVPTAQVEMLGEYEMEDLMRHEASANCPVPVKAWDVQVRHGLLTFDDDTPPVPVAEYRLYARVEVSA